ncbi:MAG: phosphatidylglycerol lysyltransferase domain-containing protein [Odoribacter sp.]
MVFAEGEKLGFCLSRMVGGVNEVARSSYIQEKERMMIAFKSVTPGDRELLASYIFPGDRRDSNLSVASLCCWQFLNCSSYAVCEGQLVIRFCFPDIGTVYTFPAGEESGKKVIFTLVRQAKEEGLPFYLYGVLPDMQQVLDRLFPEVFEYRSNRDHFDYLYLRRDLAELRGKDYQPKRNHINKFRKSYDYRYTPMTKEMVADCMVVYHQWCEERRCSEDEGLGFEQRALIYGMEHFSELALKGGVLWVEGKMIAFTFGAMVNHDTFGVHAEKALMAFEGAYNVIHQEFATHLPSSVVYLNREEDLGIEGLRRAKLSYRPIRLLEKGVAVCAEGTWDKILSL